MLWFYLTLGAVLILFVIVLYYVVRITRDQMESKLKAQKHQLTNNIAH